MVTSTNYFMRLLRLNGRRHHLFIIIFSFWAFDAFATTASYNSGTSWTVPDNVYDVKIERYGLAERN